MYKMLLVDDDYITREGLRDLIDWQGMGIEIAGEAEDGEEALQKAKVLQPDIVLSDVVMPVMDGIKLAEILKDELPEAKLVMVSAHQDIHYIKSAMKLEAIDYILKPFSMDELKETIGKVVQKLEKDRLDKRLKGDFQRNLGDSISAAVSSDIVDIQDNIINSFGKGQPEVLENSIRVFFETVRKKKMNSILFLTAICTEILAKCMRRLPANIREKASEDSINFMRQFSLTQDSSKLEEIFTQKLVALENLIQEASGSKSRRIIREVETIIKKRYHENLTIQQLADEVYMSSGHLHSLFKKETGTTINDYITSTRMEKAKELLKNPSVRIYEVANQVGYQDTNYFAKTFRKLVGVSPVDYRESII